jgi:monoamine oxidase
MPLAMQNAGPSERPTQNRLAGGDTIFLAGEALHGEQSGTVEGALHSGELAARKALRD